MAPGTPDPNFWFAQGNVGRPRPSPSVPGRAGPSLSGAPVVQWLLWLYRVSRRDSATPKRAKLSGQQPHRVPSLGSGGISASGLAVVTARLTCVAMQFSPRQHTRGWSLPASNKTTLVAYLAHNRWHGQLWIHRTISVAGPAALVWWDNSSPACWSRALSSQGSKHGLPRRNTRLPLVSPERLSRGHEPRPSCC